MRVPSNLKGSNEVVVDSPHDLVLFPFSGTNKRGLTLRSPRDHP